MRVSIPGLIRRLDNLRERINDLFELLEDNEDEQIEIEKLENFFSNDDTFNLAIATDVLEQADKLDMAFEIIKKKRVNVQAFFYSSDCVDYNKHYNHYEDLTQEEYDLLKEVLL